MISKLTLRNFKVFERQAFSIGRLTLLTGINGMGKSSVVQSLLLLKQSHEIGFLSKSERRVDLSNDFANLESAGDLCFTRAELDDKQIEIGIDLDSGESFIWKLDANNPKERILNCRFEGNATWENQALFQPNFVFLGAERFGPREIYFHKEKRNINTKLGIQGELTPSYILNAIAANEEVGSKSLIHLSLNGSAELYSNINAWMSSILGITLKARVTEVDESSVRLSYNLQGSKGANFSALQVGFGLTYTLPVVVALLSGEVGSLVVLENPEAHLHPSAQLRLGLLICRAAAAGIQVIMESHSDHILNSLRLAVRENILPREESKVIFVKNAMIDDYSHAIIDYVEILERGKLDHRPPDFFDTWDSALTRLI